MNLREFAIKKAKEFYEKNHRLPNVVAVRLQDIHKIQNGGIVFQYVTFQPRRSCLLENYNICSFKIKSSGLPSFHFIKNYKTDWQSIGELFKKEEECKTRLTL